MTLFCPQPGCRLVRVTRERPGALNVLAQARHDHVRCPTCRTLSTSVHSRYDRRPTDLPVSGNEVRLQLAGRRFYFATQTPPEHLRRALPASVHDSHGGVVLLRASRYLWRFLSHCFADRAHRGERVGTATAITIEVVAPHEGQKGFAVQPRRWVIERTLSWISRCRRLAKDHEATASSALAFFVLAEAMILVRRLARKL